MPKGGYENIAEVKSAIVDYIWGYYQSVRPHRFNDYLPPAEKEKRYFNQNLLSAVLNYLTTTLWAGSNKSISMVEAYLL